MCVLYSVERDLSRGFLENFRNRSNDGRDHKEDLCDDHHSVSNGIMEEDCEAYEEDVFRCDVLFHVCIILCGEGFV